MQRPMSSVQIAAELGTMRDGAIDIIRTRQIPALQCGGNAWLYGAEPIDGKRPTATVYGKTYSVTDTTTTLIHI
jgi:hypothetical protein